MTDSCFLFLAWTENVEAYIYDFDDPSTGWVQVTGPNQGFMDRPALIPYKDSAGKEVVLAMDTIK